MRQQRIMTPYYQDDAVTLYHGDCREILPALGSDLEPALVLTDPPYGMGYRPVRSAPGSQTKWMREAGIDSVVGDDEPFDPAPLLHFQRLVLFGANWYADKLPPSGGWLVWDKTPKGAKEGFYASHAELAWTNLCSSVRKFSLQWGGEARNGEGHLHPTQKPVGLMRWVLEQFTEPGDLILDPYTGSGPVLQACVDTGRRAIGIEIEERYCEIAAMRCAQEVLDLGVVA